jgi:hypothetical protein
MTEPHARRHATHQAAVASRAAAVLVAAVARLSIDQQKRLVRHRVALPGLVAKMLAQIDETAGPADRLVLSPRGPAEVSQGEGLGERLSPEEGRRRLRDYATPMALEDWAGATAGPMEVERSIGVPRSTLHAWQGRGLVIGLMNGVRRKVFPVEQFVDGKPIAGIADVLTVIGEPRTAWRWLKEPSPLLNGATPLAGLKRGRLDEVLNAAKTNFGQ